MKRQKAVKILSIIVSICGIVVIIGWVFDVIILKSILSIWVTMKFSTALSFFFSGVTLFFIAKSIEGEFTLAQVVLPITTLIIFILMTALLASTFLGLHTGVEDLFVMETRGAVNTLTPGRPSVGTMISFVLVAIAGVLSMLNPAGLKLKLLGIGSAVGIVGILAVAGYAINAPPLYYSISNRDTAMALHTAILFVMLGAGLVLLKENNVD